MPHDPCIITAMWGTTNLSLSLICSKSGDILAQKEGEGISLLKGRSAESVLFTLIDEWIEVYTINGVYLSGMVGSNIGWVEVPYMDCPIQIDRIRTQTKDFVARGMSMKIVPGLRCINPFGQPDVMRGEETELLAWLSKAAPEQLKNSIVCIPGTHAKWVKIKNGKVDSFFTSVVGEVFHLLSNNGILTGPQGPKSVHLTTVFRKALKDITDYPETLLTLMFAARANAICGNFSSDYSADYLSGLLIGADLNVAIKTFGRTVFKVPVPIIGAQHLAQLYAEGLSQLGLSAQIIKATDIGAAGLYSVYQGQQPENNGKISL